MSGFNLEAISKKQGGQKVPMLNRKSTPSTQATWSKKLNKMKKKLYPNGKKSKNYKN